MVERTPGWLKSFRRLRYRVDRTATSFHAFVYLAMLVLCVRRLVPAAPIQPTFLTVGSCQDRSSTACSGQYMRR